MSTLLAELASNEILPVMTVKRLREYITDKYPHLSPARRAGIFADAVHRIVAGRLPELPEEKAGLFKAFLYGDAAQKQAFCIDCSDVFKTSLKLKTKDERFVKGLASWLEKSLMSPVSEDKVFEYVDRACRMLEETPDIDIEKVLETVENDVGDIRPKKRVISLVHMHQSFARDNADRAEPGMTAVLDGTGGKDPGRASVTGDADGRNFTKASKPGNTVIMGPGWNADEEGAGDDWIIIRKKKSAIESITGRISGLTAYAAGICRRIAGLAADTSLKGSGSRIAAISGLFAAALLLTFLSAVYVKGITNNGSGKDDHIEEPAGIAMADKAMIPAGVPAADEGKERGEIRGEVLRMTATAYDLSVESCGKDRGHPEYGITFSGTRAEAGRTVAVDPEVIPLGSIIRITFPEEYSHMDGIYVAEDTGSLIKGNRIDIFFGEDEAGSREVNKKALEFGVRYVDVEILDNKQALR